MISLFPSRTFAEERIEYILGSMQGEIRILGISLRDFFHAGSRYYPLLQNCKFPIRALLLDPFCDQGKLRSQREEPGIKDGKGNLASEVETSERSITRLHEQQDVNIKSRKYSAAPCCFLILTEESVIVEPYHYGSKSPDATILGGKVPVLEFSKNSSVYTELSGRFEFLWDMEACED